ncbi:MAG: hypothetical protein K0U78_16430 [Actinomycetia bacterium]|nr:hypothetical protein [Actinomycetes bacterium]
MNSAACAEAPVAAATVICPPELVWKRLAPLVAAPGRSRIRMWNPNTDKFSDTAKLTDRLPSRPAATYLYTRGRRTQAICLDFDAKRHDAAAVTADMATASTWIIECGGVIVADRSTSGGGHLICPLAIGTSASLHEMIELVRLLAARLPTLDITPNTNPSTGCITPPGSPCREGGFRQLVDSLDAAMEALTTRSAPDLLPRLYMLLGALKGGAKRAVPAITEASNAAEAHDPTYTEGRGDELRIAAPYLRTDAMPTAQAEYAAHGALNRARWPSNHEARMSVVVHAVARGHSLASLRTMIEPEGPWHDGLGKAYHRYHHRADQALARDTSKALTWLVSNVLVSSPPRHKKKYTPGGQQGARGPESLRGWLANALAWADQEFAGKRIRWTVHAVLQALAFHAFVAGEERSGAWVVGVGGRSLSLSCGLLSEDTIWRTLADLRDREGAPLLLVRRHIATEADVYALTMQNQVSIDVARAERVRVEPVHDAWNVLGHHLRRIYELVAQHGLRAKADIYAAAAVPRSTGDAMVIELEIAGLLTRSGWGTVADGPATLDQIADSHQLEEARQNRLKRFSDERMAWRKWLADRERLRGSSRFTGDGPATVAATGCAPRGPEDDVEYAAWLDSVMATGPPDENAERVAIEVVAEILGGHIVAAARPQGGARR